MLATLQPWQKTLLDAAEIIKTRGLWKFPDLESWADESQCALSATMASAPDLATYDAARAALSKHIGVEDVARWNDRPERTADEVIRALQEAAQTSVPPHGVSDDLGREEGAGNG